MLGPVSYSVGSFLVALAILITVHEFGHFAAARLLGVGVTRFSIGFGWPLLTYRRRPEATEFVLAAVPLGGYVKMIDEREEEVAPERLHQAFNRQSLARRAAIVAAGPFANLVFAVLAYWLVFAVAGDSGLRAVVAAVEPDSIAARAGFQAGDRLLQVGGREAVIWDQAVFALMAESFAGRDLPVRVRDAAGQEQERLIEGEALAALPSDGTLIRRLGLNGRPLSLLPIVGEVIPGEPAAQGGLAVGDRILSVDGEPIRDWAHWVEIVQARPNQDLPLTLERGGESIRIVVTPRAFDQDGKRIGRVGAGVRLDRVEVRYTPLSALREAADKTLDMSLLTARVLGQLVVGRASVETLSGPITMAQVAGKTASTGWDSFVIFLAVVSVSLAVLNLLPIPVLDGGHLLYFFIEWVKGSPLSETVQIVGQKIGIVLIVALMGLAFYSDLARVFG